MPVSIAFRPTHVLSNIHTAFGMAYNITSIATVLFPVANLFHLYRDRSVGIQPIKLSKFGILFTASPSTSTRLHNFYEILGVCTRIWIAFKFLIWSLSGDKRPTYKHFPAVEAFSDKLSIAPTGKTTDRIKQVRVQKWHGSPLSPCQVWWGSWAARRLE